MSRVLLLLNFTTCPDKYRGFIILHFILRQYPDF